jgi:hypothetical protein
LLNKQQQAVTEALAELVEMLTAVTVAMPTAAMQQHVTTDAAHTLNLT